MFQLRQNLAFAAESSYDFIRVGAALQNFDGYVFVEFTICPRGKENGSHSAPTNLPNNSVSADARSNPARRDRARNRVAQTIGAGFQFLAGYIQIGLNLFAQVGVMSARFGYECLACVTFAFQRFTQDFLHFLPELRSH